MGSKEVMTEAYSISSRLTFTSNAATVVADLIVQFERLDRVMAASQGALGKLSAEMRTLGNGSRGITKTIQAIEKLGQVRLGSNVVTDIEKVITAARQLAEVQATIARETRETAAAWRGMARQSPRAAAPGTPAAATAAAAAGSGRPPRAPLPPVGGGGDGGPVDPPRSEGGPAPGPRQPRRNERQQGQQGGAWQQAWRDSYANAQWDNADHDARRTSQHQLATRENDRRDRLDRGRQQQADRQYDAERKAAEYQNAQFDAAARAAAKTATERQRQIDLAAGKKYDAAYYEADQANRALEARKRRERMSHTDWATAGMGATMAGEAGLGFFGSALKAEMEVREHLAMLRTNKTFSDTDIADIRARAEKVTQQIPGSTLAENLHHTVDLFTALGDMHETAEGLPAFARAAYLFKNMPGVHKGDTSFAAAQAVEVMQRHTVDGKVDTGAFNKAMDAMVQVAYGTGGRVDGSTYLGFAKQSRAGGMVANDQYLYRDLPAMLVALGGHRGGTGDAAVWRQFVQGRMTQAAAEELIKAGILDKKSEWSHGRVVNIEKHLVDADGFGANRIQWLRDAFLGPNGVLAKNNIDVNNKLDVERFFSKWASTAVGLGFISEGVLGMPNIDKEGKKIDETRESGGILQTLRDHDPAQAVREFKAAENELMVALGKEALGPAIEMLRSLTEAIHYLANAAKAHPDAARNLTLIGGGLSLLAVGAGEVATVIFLGAPIIKGLSALARAVSPFGPGGEAAIAMANAPSALSTLATGIVTFVARLSAITLPLTLSGDTPGGGKPATPEQIDAAKKRADELNRQTGQSGNLLHDLGKWWRGDTGGKPTEAIPPAQNPFQQHGSLTRPPSEPNVTFLATITLDGREIASNVSGRLIRSGSGPSGGSTGFDARTIYAGGMNVG